jgi:hypothetical protein
VKKKSSEKEKNDCTNENNPLEGDPVTKDSIGKRCEVFVLNGFIFLF